MRAALLALFAWLAAALPAAGAVTVNGVTLDPGSTIRPALLQSALLAWENTPGARRDVLAVVDFSLPSSAARLYVVNLATGAVRAYLTAHGKGSDPGHTGRALSFSNVSGSHASSLGTYRAGARYQGVHGLSLRLEGRDPTNAAAEARAIVLHSAPYMDAPFRARFGKPGRSFGCFVVETAEIETVVTALENGAVIYAGT